MENKEHSFVLKEDGKIYWIEKMPYKPKPEYCNSDRIHGADVIYQQALQSAIDNAVEVSNQDEFHRNSFSINGWQPLEVGKVYSLQCRVEKKETPDNRDSKLVALVTFDSPPVEEQRETQEEEILKHLHNKIMVQWEKDFGSIHNEQLMDAYTVSGFIKAALTRKPQPPKQ
jgi:hypothetical protein